MTNKEKFDGFDFNLTLMNKRPVSVGEMKQLTNPRLNSEYAGAEQKALGEKMNAIYRKLADLR